MIHVVALVAMVLAALLLASLLVDEDGRWRN